ncbi:MAG: 23S rRNA (pseudouridine(1915)-N(3))-methyltransferase RlmH [Deltaproteobacteria bacterium]
MNINIICVGKIKEAYIKAGLDEYSKRLSKYCKLNVTELQDEKVADKTSEKELEIIQKTEAERIKSALKSGCTIVLDFRGKQLKSEEFAEKIAAIGVSGQSTINFIIGGSIGLSEEIRKNADFVLSFSNLTFPHQLIRLFLYEQLFRCFKIIKGETYHK